MMLKVASMCMGLGSLKEMVCTRYSGARCLRIHSMPMKFVTCSRRQREEGAGKSQLKANAVPQLESGTRTWGPSCGPGAPRVTPSGNHALPTWERRVTSTALNSQERRKQERKAPPGRHQPGPNPRIKNFVGSGAKHRARVRVFESQALSKRRQTFALQGNRISAGGQNDGRTGPFGTTAAYNRDERGRGFLTWLLCTKMSLPALMKSAASKHGSYSVVTNLPCAANLCLSSTVRMG